MLVAVYRQDVDPGPRLLVPQVAALHSVRRALAAEARAASPDRSEVEALSLVLLEKGARGARRHSPAVRAVGGGRGSAAGAG